MMCELSIIIPGIRNHNWPAVYDSIQKSAGPTTLEVIFIGPDSSNCPSNAIFVKDFGNPSRCAQLGLLTAKGKYVTWGSDDCLYCPNVISDIMSKLRVSTENTVISVFYHEGCTKFCEKDWFINVHEPAASPYIPDSYFLIMNGFVNREYLLSLGGWDCRFEAWAMGNVDLGVRLQRDGANVIVYPTKVMDCTHMPGTSGDHAPIHNAQNKIDQPLYKKLYNVSSCLNRTAIDIDNWKSQPSIWSRFNKV